MSIIEDAICWDGVYAKLLLYVVSPGEEPLWTQDFQLGGTVPKSILGPYLLEDEGKVLQGKTLAVYELTLEAYPQDLKAYLMHCSTSALAGGGELVWFAFDGGFDFEHVLSRDFAQEVYFLQPAGGVPSVAIDDDVRAGEGWAQVVLGARRMLADGQRIRSLEDLVAMKGSGSVIDKLVPVPHERLALLRAEDPEMPEQFSEFLRVIGCGTVGESSYSIYGGLVEPCELYAEEDAAKFSEIMLFGDDFSGWNAGFVMATGCVVEIDSFDMSVEQVAEDFQSFISAKVEEIAARQSRRGSLTGQA